MSRRILLVACLLALLVPAVALAQSLMPMGSVAPAAPGEDAPGLDAPWAEAPGAPVGEIERGARIGHRGPHRARAPRAPRESFAAVVRFLDLDEGQADALRDLLERRREAVEPIHMRIRQLEHELKTLLDEGAGPGRIGAQVIAIHEARERARGIVLRSQRAFIDLLDPDQRERYGAVQRAARLQPAVHAFRSLRLLAPPPGDEIDGP